MDVAAVVAGLVLAQRVEGEVAHRQVLGGLALEVAQQAGAEALEGDGARVDEQLGDARSSAAVRRTRPSGSPCTVVRGPTGMTPRRWVGTTNSSSWALPGAQRRQREPGRR